MPPSEAAFRRPKNAAALVDAIRGLTAGPRPLRIMEICGTHTMAIAQAGLRSLLAPGVRLVSGPGCPVCVTPAGAIDAVLELSGRPGIVIASYGDLLRVPGTVRGGHPAAAPCPGREGPDRLLPHGRAGRRPVQPFGGSRLSGGGL